jgi:hypothetical protein
MQGDSSELEYRLQVWAEWSARSIDSGMGYANETLESKLMRMGCIIRYKGVQYITENPQAEEIEAGLVNLAETNKMQVYCIRARYVGELKVDGRASLYIERVPVFRSNAKLAKELKISVKTFERYIKEAKSFLDGWLRAKEALRHQENKLQNLRKAA